MTIPTFTVEATLQSDGLTLQLEKKLALPPGRVIVTVQRAEQKSGPTMLETLDHIHREQQRRGRKPITEAEMAAEIDQLRGEDEEYEERWREIWAQTDSKNDRTNAP